MFELKDKIALVTGARQGMGRTHALVLAGQGARVIVTNRTIEGCQDVVDEIISKGGEAVCFGMDVASKTEIDQVFDEVVKKYGRLDILVNNAGVYIPKSAMEMTEEDWDKTLDINLKGQFFCAQRAAKEMAKNKWGRIVNITSIGSGGVGIGFANSTHYVASKGGIIGMTEALASEWAEMGITVNAIGPGMIDTRMVREPGKELDKEISNEVKLRVPLKRIGRPEEVSAMVVFLASEESSYITGATFYVDGGWLAQ